MGHNIKDPASQFHYPERMLKPLMGSTRINKVRHRQLVYISKALKRVRVKYLPFITV